MLLPSKELLSEVLGCNIKDIYIYKINSNPNFGNNELMYSISGVGDILSINTYELAFLIRDYFHKKYKHDLDMSLEINEIFKNATQFYETVK